MNLTVNAPTTKEVGDITNGLLTSISHDLGTPLSAILLWTKVLSEQQEELSPQEFKDGLQAIRECVEEQLAIIDDIVDTSRIATGHIRLKPERVNLVETLSGTIESFRQRADEKALELREEIDPELGVAVADSRRLTQLAGSLFGSAISRSPRGATIEISCARHGESVKISVGDVGEGIGSEAIHMVLEQFPTRQSPLSKGTTLYTAARLARLFGGNLDIRSDAGKVGARCTLTLDLPLSADEVEPLHDEEIAQQRTIPQQLLRSLTSQPEHISARPETA